MAKKLIVFVCEHGAAKSVIASAYFNKLAAEKDLELQSVARGTTPDEELSPNTIAGLQKDGLTPIESIPQKLRQADVESAQKVITFCELPEEYQSPVSIENWNDIPPVSEDYEKARDAIIEHLSRLMNNL